MRVTLTFALLALSSSACVDVVQHGTNVQLALEEPCNAADAVTADAWKLRAFSGSERLFERELSSFPSVVALAGGTNLHLEFEALQGGVVVGRGASLHFDVVEGRPSPEGLLISVKPLGRFVQRCAGLTHARSGHTATLLADGSVLIVGGLDTNGTALASIEHLGVVNTTEVGPLGIRAGGNVVTLPRAFHSAVRLENGQVLIAGGENVAMTGAPSAVVSTIVVIDPSLDFGQGALSTSANSAWVGRSRHAAFLDGVTVLFAGGVMRSTMGVTAADTLQRLMTTSFTFGATTLTTPTDESGITFFANDVVYAGGIASGATSDLVRFVPASGGNARDVRLMTARSLPAVFPLGGKLLVSGGIDSNSQFIDRSEWLDTTGSTPGPQVSARAKACVVPLPDGRVFLFGGLSANGPTNVAELLSPDGTVVAISNPAIAGRVDHTCTLLEDGSILIAGGRTNAGPASDLWQFAP
ncbi:MAG: kelch repeat-containing protein [Archangium sp.]